jgi:NADH-quinone oxidoreductase subunit M
MFENIGVLSVVTFTPLVGALFILLVVRGTEEEVARNSRWAALWVSLFTFLESLYIWIKFDPATPDFQFVENVPWIPEYDISCSASSRAGKRSRRGCANT